METKFKCKDEVIYRFNGGAGHGEPDLWTYGIFSHYKKDGDIVINGNSYKGSFIEVLPLKGNESLVGTSDEPKRKASIKEGEWMVFCGEPDFDYRDDLYVGIFSSADNDTFNLKGCYERFFGYAVKLSDFNPHNMEQTKKHIMYVQGSEIYYY